MEGDREPSDYRMSMVEWTSIVPCCINTMQGMATTAGSLNFVCRTQKPNSGNQVRMSLYTSCATGHATYPRSSGTLVLLPPCNFNGYVRSG